MRLCRVRIEVTKWPSQLSADAAGSSPEESLAESLGGVAVGFGGALGGSRRLPSRVYCPSDGNPPYRDRGSGLRGRRPDRCRRSLVPDPATQEAPVGQPRSPYGTQDRTMGATGENCGATGSQECVPHLGSPREQHDEPDSSAANRDRVERQIQGMGIVGRAAVVPVGMPGDFDEIGDTCWSGVDDRYPSPPSMSDRGGYEALLEAADCLRELGVVIPQAPSFDTWRDHEVSPQKWDPFSFIESGDDFKHLNSYCHHPVSVSRRSRSRPGQAQGRAKRRLRVRPARSRERFVVHGRQHIVSW